MRLPSKDPDVEQARYSITKDGRIFRNDKELSLAYEKKYASDIISNHMFITDKKGKETVRDKKGRFVSKEITDKVHVLKTYSVKKVSKNVESDKIAPFGRKLKGSIMKANYAITTLCTCEVIEKGYEKETKGKVVKHYYTVSTNERLSYSDLIQSHNSDYPLHDLINIEVVHTKEVSFE